MSAKATKSATEKNGVSNSQKVINKTAKRAVKAGKFVPVFIGAEEMYERKADLAKETARKAYEISQRRGGGAGRELDDWIRAESEILLPVPVELTETINEISLRAAIPGFKPDEIEVSLTENQLFLCGKSENEGKKANENTIYSEWHSNKFCRQLSLPRKVDAEKATAKLDNGILQLTLPKPEVREITEIFAEDV